MTVHYIDHSTHQAELHADRVNGGLRMMVCESHRVAVVQIPADDVRQVLQELRTEAAIRDSAAALLRAEYAELLAHARAAIAAARLKHHAPLTLLEGHLEERGQLPEPGAQPEAEAARAYAASPNVHALTDRKGVSA
jgi:hypothetical protein